MNNKNFILVLNCGSTTVKYSLFEKENLDLKQEGKVERIGLEGELENHAQAIEVILKGLKKQIKISDIKAVGHRVVHGGSFYKPVFIDDSVIKKLKSLINLAPLHNPHNIKGIETITKVLPKVSQVACFDTAFYSDLPRSAYIYPIPYRFYKQQGIRRYGFHGISHHYVSERAQQILDKKAKKMIICHLGGGCSVTAIKNNKAVATSMGFTPLEGLVMSTRSGDIDPALVTYLSTELNYEPQQVYDILNFKSGLVGLCEERDFREILKNKDKKPRLELAYNIFCNSVIKYIGYYTALLKGIDAIVFTAGIGENSWEVRKNIIEHFQFLGVRIEQSKNQDNQLIISDENSEVKVLVVPTNEALKIAQETKQEVAK